MDYLNLKQKCKLNSIMFVKGIKSPIGVPVRRDSFRCQGTRQGTLSRNEVSCGVRKMAAETTVEEQDVNMEESTPSKDQGGQKMFTLKKWNAVAMWSWDVECDTCAICRVQVMGKLRDFEDLAYCIKISYATACRTSL